MSRPGGFAKSPRRDGELSPEDEEPGQLRRGVARLPEDRDILKTLDGERGTING
jgi:hypothetical protein